MMTVDSAILVINCGSSSVKFALFDPVWDDPRRIWQGAVERIGFDAGRFTVIDTQGVVVVYETLQVTDHDAALDLLLSWVDGQASGPGLTGVGHRVVHGGADCDCPLFVTPALQDRLEHLTPLAPLHLPHNLAGIKAVGLRRPDLPQIACFDPAFHDGLPRVAQLTGLPRRFDEDGIRRYGFHGLSYEYVIDEIRRRRGDRAASARIVAAHLGNGASMAAIKGGRSIETSMSFSTLAGLPMGTRPGDLDPGILLYLLEEKKITPGDLQQVLYHQSGLLGRSGLSRNMADLLARQDLPEAAEAVEFFCHHARRHLAGLTASLGGLDRLVFTGGVGANSPEIRARICQGLGYLGLEIDADRNLRQESLISADDSAVMIEAFMTDEELVIARHVRDLSAADSMNGKAHAHG